MSRRKGVLLYVTQKGGLFYVTQKSQKYAEWLTPLSIALGFAAKYNEPDGIPLPSEGRGIGQTPLSIALGSIACLYH